MLEFYKGEFERCGFIMTSGEVIEVENMCNDKKMGFEISPEDLMKYVENGDAVATWHTHPNSSNVLSSDDYHGFRNWPNLKHYIIGDNGIAAYIVVGEDVLIAD